MYVCLCRGITDSQIKQAVAEGAENTREVSDMLGTAKQCGKCGMVTRQIIQKELNTKSSLSDQFYSA